MVAPSSEGVTSRAAPQQGGAAPSSLLETLLSSFMRMFANMFGGFGVAASGSGSDKDMNAANVAAPAIAPAPQTAAAVTPPSDRPLPTQFLSAPSSAPASNSPASNSNVYVWGDSHANAIGHALKLPKSHNLGEDGAGLTIGHKPAKLDGVSFDKGATLLMSMGSNDVGTALRHGDDYAEKYAARLIAIAQQAQKQGAQPVIIGMRAPDADKPVKGMSKAWKQDGYQEEWTAKMHEINAAVEKAAQANGIAYSAPAADLAHAGDNFHYTGKAYGRMAQAALGTVKADGDDTRMAVAKKSTPASASKPA